MAGPSVRSGFRPAYPVFFTSPNFCVKSRLEHHLKELKLPSILREYGKMAAQCAAEGVDHPQYLLRLAELELIDRHQRMGWSGGSAPPASPP